MILMANEQASYPLDVKIVLEFNSSILLVSEKVLTKDLDLAIRGLASQVGNFIYNEYKLSTRRSAFITERKDRRVL